LKRRKKRIDGREGLIRREGFISREGFIREGLIA